MNDYQTKGYTKYGAQMGRRSDLENDTMATLTVRQVPLNEGGYDPGGAYWGGPNDLFCVSDDEGHVSYLRAYSPSVARAKFPRASWAPITEGPTEEDLAEMLDGYITCALWVSNDENGPLDANYSADDLAPETRAEMKKYVETFAGTTANAEAIKACLEHRRCDWSRAGHDLWLTRNGSGISFSENWPSPHCSTLDNAARADGEVNLYVGDDGKIYCA
jgi:hypothetical protein